MWTKFLRKQNPMRNVKTHGQRKRGFRKVHLQNIGYQVIVWK